MRGTLVVTAAIAAAFAGCSVSRSLSPAETVHKFVRAVRQADVQGVENMAGSQLRQIGVLVGRGLLAELEKRFPQKVPYRVIDERITGETAYVEVRLLLSPEWLWEFRKPNWTLGPLGDETAFEAFFFGRPAWLPDRSELLTGAVPIEVLRKWIDAPPGTSYREARAALAPIIRESDALGPRPYTPFTRGGGDERAATWDAKAAALRARARAILNGLLIPAATYDALARRYVVDREAKVYAERHRFVLGREDGKWLVRDVTMLDAAGEEVGW